MEEKGTPTNPLPWQEGIRYAKPNERGIAWSPDTRQYHQLPAQMASAEFTPEQVQALQKIATEAANMSSVARRSIQEIIDILAESLKGV